MHPTIIQGGMGVAVSDWRLARAVSTAGQLGVVSGTGIDTVLVRRLQDGDPGGHIRRAMAAFPYPDVVEATLNRFFQVGGRSAGQPYKMLPMFKARVSAYREKVTALANFVEVHLAKEGHEGLVGINFLTKIQLPTLSSLYGAMLAGVDYVLMGAGIPKDIPGVLDGLASGTAVELKIDIQGSPGSPDEVLRLDPSSWGPVPGLTRPRFLPIVSATSLASAMLRRSNGAIDGFIIEGHTAGGHNAPPRGPARFTERGEPQYGDRDQVDLEAIAQLGLPFWLAGSKGTPEGLAEAVAAGAEGIQVGTLFAYCRESGLTEDLKARTLEACLNGTTDILTDAKASPTGFPFKVVALEDTLSEESVYQDRARVCDLGYLRVAVRDDDGGLVYRCAAEPVQQYVDKGGQPDDTEGRKCLCNALMANIGLPQNRSGSREEPALLTSGDELESMGRFLAGRTHYSASDVLAYLLEEKPVA